MGKLWTYTQNGTWNKGTSLEVSLTLILPKISVWLSKNHGLPSRMLLKSILWKKWNRNSPDFTSLMLTPFLGCQTIVIPSFINCTLICLFVRNHPTKHRLGFDFSPLLSSTRKTKQPSSSSTNKFSIASNQLTNPSLLKPQDKHHPKVIVSQENINHKKPYTLKVREKPNISKWEKKNCEFIL